MKLSGLRDFLESQIGIKDFKTSIKSEVSEYARSLQISRDKKGTTTVIPVYEDVPFHFKTSYLVSLLNFYINDDLDEIEIYFIVDCLTLSIYSEASTCDSEYLLDSLCSMGDPEINGGLTKINAMELRKKLLNE